MSGPRANKHLHGVKVDQLVQTLVDHYGWDGLAALLSINCFKKNTSVKSSVKFLLKTPWALANVQDLYVALVSGDPEAIAAEKFLARVPKREREPKPASPRADEAAQVRTEKDHGSTVWSGKNDDAEQPTADAPDPNDPWAKARRRH